MIKMVRSKKSFKKKTTPGALRPSKKTISNKTNKKHPKQFNNTNSSDKNIQKTNTLQKNNIMNNNSFADKIKTLENELIKKETKEKIIDSKLQEKVIEISTLKKSFLSLQNENGELIEKIDLLDKKNKFFEKELEDLFTDIDTADQEINEHISTKNQLVENNAYLQRELENRDLLLKSRNSQIESLSKDYEDLYKKYLTLNNSSKTTKKSSKKTTKKTQIKNLDLMDEQILRIEKLEKIIKSKNDEIDELINRIEMQEIKIEELEEEINNEMKTRTRLEKAYNRLKGMT